MSKVPSVSAKIPGGEKKLLEIRSARKKGKRENKPSKNEKNRENKNARQNIFFKLKTKATKKTETLEKIPKKVV